MSASTLKGAIAEAAITSRAVELGIVVLRPLVEGRRYDLVFDVDHRLYRVQCKWAPRRGAVILVQLGSCRHTPRGYVRSTYSADEVDAIAVYCQELKGCYWLPIDLVAGRRQKVDAVEVGAVGSDRVDLVGSVRGGDVATWRMARGA